MISYLRNRVRDLLADRLRVPSIESSLRRIAKTGFTPLGVYDVGAYKGEFTKTVLHFWGNTNVTCFEPQTDLAPDLDRLKAMYPNQIEYHQCLLGAKPQEEVVFHVGGTGSSVLSNSEGTQYPTTRSTMVSLDSFRAQQMRKPCSLLKLDVQGYELEVLKGAEDTLRDETEVILAEVNLIEVYSGAPLMHETIAWLAERDFVVYDICSQIRRPLDDALWQTDLLFTRKSSRLRSDRRWIASEAS